jgi:hypothetical protein
MEILPVGAEVFHADGHTDRWMDGHTGRYYKLTAAFHNFANVPKKDIRYKSRL